VRDAVIGVEEAWACGAGVREGVVDGGVRGVISRGGLEEVDGDGRGRGEGGFGCNAGFRVGGYW